MRKRNRSGILLVAIMSLCVLFCVDPLYGMAAEREAYTYTITFYAGNRGHFLENAGVDVSPGQDIQISNKGSALVVSGLHYNSRVSFNAQGAMELEGDKYYVRGIRKSGTDNSEAQVGSPSFEVTGDQDYVVAYGVRGDLVKYTVNYQDDSGNTLRPSEEYHGNAGDFMVVAYLYIEGYQPQAYNLGRTLTKEGENVFTFIYTPVLAGGNAESGTGGTEAGDETGIEEAENRGITGDSEGDAAEPAQQAGGAEMAEPGAGAEGAGAAAEGAGAEGVGAEADVNEDADMEPAENMEIPDDEVPQAEIPEELQILDDDEKVPLTNLGEKEKTAENIRSIAGAAAIAVIGAAALIGLLVLWMKKRKRNNC